MSKSKARKFREKLVREGNRNPELGRSPFAMLDLNTRKTKTKKDKLNQMKHKKQSFGRDDFQTKDCFLFCLREIIDKKRRVYYTLLSKSFIV